MPRGKWGEGQLTFKQWHHLYLGLLLIIVRLFFVHSRIIGFLGGFIFMDDLIQHFVQWKWDNSYQSSLHYLYVKLIWEPLYAHKDL